jgi:hypothetical protein
MYIDPMLLDEAEEPFESELHIGEPNRWNKRHYQE